MGLEGPNTFWGGTWSPIGSGTPVRSYQSDLPSPCGVTSRFSPRCRETAVEVEEPPPRIRPDTLDGSVFILQVLATPSLSKKKHHTGTKQQEGSFGTASSLVHEKGGCITPILVCGWLWTHIGNSMNPNKHTKSNLEGLGVHQRSPSVGHGKIVCSILDTWPTELHEEGEKPLQQLRN